MNELIYAYDAAEILNVSKQRILQIIKSERIPVTYIGRIPYFNRREVETYAKTRKVGRPAKK